MLPTERFREIRGVEQRRRSVRRRWFQSAYFDLFITENSAGEMLWFQLCYARDTWRERVLEWRRGRGFQHLKVRDFFHPARKDSGELVLDGAMPYFEVVENFNAASPGLPPPVARLVADKIHEYARPSRKFRRPGLTVPRWLERMRERERVAARLACLDSAETDR